jgi:hypothetical protein
LPGTGVNRPNIGNRPNVGNNIGNRIGSGNVNINVDRSRINQQINNRYRNIQTRPFTRGWWSSRPAHLPAHRWYPWHNPRYRPGYWWRWATAATVTRWVAFGWRQPVYYSYGTGGNVYYENNIVYVDGEQNCTAEEYYQQATEITAGMPEISEQQAEEIEWMSLGVFALTQEGIDDTNMLLQLAVSKEGIIAGTFYNESTDSTRPVEGTVDKDTQRVAWSFADGKNADVVMETTIYNLTKDEATALVHFGVEQTQTWVLVRLDEPEEQAE